MPNTAPMRPIRLSDFILEYMPKIMQEWENFARSIAPPDAHMATIALRDDAESMLRAVAMDLAAPQTETEQSEKSKGRARPSATETAAQTHAGERLLSGFTIDQLVAEFRALRASVLKLWAAASDQILLTDIRDITRFNEAIDQALAESIERYTQMANHSHNLFLAILGHDLRNPLGATLTASRYLLAAPNLPSEHALAAKRILNSGQRMAKLVDDLIDFSRTHLGPGIPLAPREVNIEDVVLRTVEELRTLHRDRQIALSGDGKLEGYWDENRIAQVFSNLISNALQYGDKAEPVTVKLRAENGYVVADISNFGNPIPAKQLPTIFDPLVRFADTDAMDHSQNNNLGIGLYIAREVVLAHSGTIAVQSSKEDGTTFCVRLPQNGPQPKAAHASA